MRCSPGNNPGKKAVKWDKFGLNASNYLLSVMGSDAAGIALTREYLDIIFYGTFIVLIQISLNGILLKAKGQKY